MIAALQRIGVATQQRQQPRHDRRHALSQCSGIGALGFGRCIERAQYRQGQPAVRARGVNGHVDRIAQLGNTRRGLVPVGQALLPLLRHLRGIGGRRESLACRLAGIDPGLKISRRQRREIEQQVGQVTLGIDTDRRHAVDGGLFKQRQAKTGFAAAGHAHAHGMGGQVARVVQQRFGRDLAAGRVHRAS